MIDITVSHDGSVVYVEAKEFKLPDDTVRLIEEIVDRSKYSGEHILLSRVETDLEHKKFLYEW